MTVGNPTKHLLVFALPLFLGNIFQQLYNMVDSMVLGKFVGAQALAATGTCSSLNFLFFALSSGLAIGIGVIVSQYFGAGNEVKVKATIANAFYVLAFSSITASVIGILIARPILMLLSTPAEIIDLSIVYLRTTCCGIFFIAIYNGVAAILRALGDSKTPLYFLMISSAMNIVFDLTFVLKFHMGVFGVGLATVIAQAISASISMIYAFSKVSYFRVSREQLKPHKDIIFQAFRLGIPMALQSSMIATSMIVLQRVVNGFGPIVMAAYTVSAKVDLIISQLYQAMANALTTFSGQNLGANKIDRIKQGYRRGVIIVTIYNCILIPIVFMMSKGIVSIFVTDAEVISIGQNALRITSILYFALGLIYVPRGILNGCGDAMFSMINGITEVACRIIYSYLLTSIASIGMYGVWWAAGLTWATAALVCNCRYFAGKWKTMAMSK